MAEKGEILKLKLKSFGEIGLRRVEVKNRVKVKENFKRQNIQICENFNLKSFSEFWCNFAISN